VGSKDNWFCVTLGRKCVEMGGRNAQREKLALRDIFWTNVKCIGIICMLDVNIKFCNIMLK
jgi:hypothetical protein